jgi:hypothetical protein
LSAVTPQVQVILPFRAPRERIADAKHFRSTWLSSSILTLRERGDYDRYLTLLEPRFRDVILKSIAGEWLPTEVAIAHYEACGALGLSNSEIVARSLDVTRRVHQTALSVAVRLAREVGVSPWTLYAQLDRVWDRVWQGGGVSVTKRGPKEAIIEVVRWRCAAVPYCRTAMPAVVLAVTEMFCRKAYVRDVTGDPQGDSLVLKSSWA